MWQYAFRSCLFFLLRFVLHSPHIHPLLFTMLLPEYASVEKSCRIPALYTSWVEMPPGKFEITIAKTVDLGIHPERAD